MGLPRCSAAAAAAKLLQSCLTLCDPIDGSPPASPVPGILQERTLEWVAISFSSAWKWKVKVKSLSPFWLFVTPWTAAYQAPPSMGFPRQESTGVGCHCLLRPRWSRSLESACHFRGHGFDPWSRKIPHAVEQLSLCATTAEPVLWNKRSYHNEKPAHRNERKPTYGNKDPAQPKINT